MLTQSQQTWTLLLMVSATILIVGFDVYTFKAHGVNTTISCVSRAIFERYPISWTLFAVWLGVLIGHLFPSR